MNASEKTSDLEKRPEDLPLGSIRVGSEPLGRQGAPQGLQRYLPLTNSGTPLMTIRPIERPPSQAGANVAGSDLACLPRIKCATGIDELAAKLIDLCSGSHSVAMVYRFLLKSQHHTEETARAEFVKFLGGELSERLLQDARHWVQEEQFGRQSSTIFVATS
jgi:hypothetical protein